MIKCECGKWFSSKKGLRIHQTKMGHGKQEVQEDNIDNSQMEEILNRIRKLELDNSFLKCQMKHKVFTNNSNDSELNWNLKPEVKKAKDETKISFSGVVKEMKSIFTEDFNYKNILTHVSGIETISIPIMVEV